MLAQLYIKNVAVISQSSMELKPGFNVFTGETGAGKSILIGSINAVLGERTSKDLIRSGEEKALISALFTDINAAAQQKLTELGFESEDGSVLITREISADAKSVCKIGGRPATVSMLRELSSLLISIHGQHDNQALLSPQRHLEFLDRYADDGELLGEYREAYHNMLALLKEMKRLSMDEAEKARMIDLLSYQVQEIEAAQLEPGEEEELAAQKKAAQNAEGILQGLAALLQLYEGEEEYGILSLLDAAEAQLEQVGRYVGEFAPMLERLRDFSFESRDFVSEIRDFMDGFEYDSGTVDRLEERLDLIYRLKKKYGDTVEEILRFGQEAQQKLDAVEQADDRLEQLRAQYDACLRRAQALSEELGRVRRQAATELIDKMQEELAFLDMPFVRFALSSQKRALGPDGADEMELLISANPGEPPKPLSKIASGGELSRIMLAMKNAIADKDDVDTLIFDEIDTGVGGRAAAKIGAKLRQAARHRQVLCVTHLAQVAAAADEQLLIQKQVEDGRTYTSIVSLPREERIGELARMIGGDAQSESARRTAKEMLDNACHL